MHIIINVSWFIFPHFFHEKKMFFRHFACTQKFKQILDGAKNGAILVSWGGNVMSSSIPQHLQLEMIKAFAKLPLQVIWKWENASMQDVVPKNVFVSSWVPQRDILCTISAHFLLR